MFTNTEERKFEYHFRNGKIFQFNFFAGGPRESPPPLGRKRPALPAAEPDRQALPDAGQLLPALRQCVSICDQVGLM